MTDDEARTNDLATLEKRLAFYTRCHQNTYSRANKFATARVIAETAWALLEHFESDATDNDRWLVAQAASAPGLASRVEQIKRTASELETTPPLTVADAVNAIENHLGVPADLPYVDLLALIREIRPRFQAAERLPDRILFGHQLVELSRRMSEATREIARKQTDARFREIHEKFASMDESFSSYYADAVASAERMLRDAATK